MWSFFAFKLCIFQVLFCLITYHQRLVFMRLSCHYTFTSLNGGRLNDVSIYVLARHKVSVVR